MWTVLSFSQVSNPPDSGSALVTWPTFTEQEQAHLVLDLKPRVERRYKAKKITFWNGIVPKVAEFTRKEEMITEETMAKDQL